MSLAYSDGFTLCGARSYVFDPPELVTQDLSLPNTWQLQALTEHGYTGTVTIQVTISLANAPGVTGVTSFNMIIECTPTTILEQI